MSEEAKLLQEAYALLAQWNCELRMTAKNVTREKVRDLFDRIKRLNSLPNAGKQETRV